jgi:hypothetical protein
MGDATTAKAPFTDFEGCGYHVDFKKLREQSLKLKRSGSQPDALTIPEILVAIGEKPVTLTDDTPGRVVFTVDGAAEWEADGTLFSEGLLFTLLQLKQAGRNPYGALWCYYASAHVVDDFHYSYRFFIVSGDEIFLEDASLSRTNDRDFMPEVLSPIEDDDPMWSDANDWQAAQVAYWYRRFYQETRTGQLMLLRPDEPPLFHYLQGRRIQGLPIAEALGLERLAKIQGLLRLVLAAIAALLLIEIWR